MPAPIGRQLVIVSGPPGAGKTTVARLVADAHDLSVHLPGDTFWAFLHRGRLDPWLDAADHQNRVVVTALVEAASSFAAGGYLCVVDFVLGPWFLDVLTSAAARHGVDAHYVVLLPDLTTTLARAVARGADGLADPGVVTDLHAQFTGRDDIDRFMLDNSELAAAPTADEVIRRITSRRCLLGTPLGSEPTTSESRNTPSGDDAEIGAPARPPTGPPSRPPLVADPAPPGQAQAGSDEGAGVGPGGRRNR